ncbi:MAG: ATP phosphoribosyltransferase regulatory subunit, partial [Pseudomonadota bacterium]
EAVDGTTLCLRPEFTIPVGLHHVKLAQNGQQVRRRYACGGMVFRQNRADGNQFDQVGVEDLGDENRIAADAACLSDFITTLSLVGLDRASITLGDQALFEALVAALDCPAPLARRLRRSFGETGQLSRVIAEASSGDATRASSKEPAVSMALAGDEDGLANLVQNEMNAAGLSPAAGRDPRAIARRMIEKTQERGVQLDPDRARILSGFLDINGPLDTGAEQLAVFTQWAGLDLTDAITIFQTRVEALRARGASLDTVSYAAAFGRKLDYYTGLVFEATSETDPSGERLSLGGGGRYDRLCSLLGSPNPVPAVGFSLSMDRIQKALEARAA